MNERLREYRKWLESQYDFAKDAQYMYEEEQPNETGAMKAKFHAKGFKEALEEFDRLFGIEEKEK